MNAPPNINAKRQISLDMARGAAVLFMVLVHVLLFHGSEVAEKSLVGEIIAFFGGPPTAPIFLLVTGTGVVYSRRSSPRRLITRGTVLFGAGYLLNALRGVIPAMLTGGDVPVDTVMPGLPQSWSLLFDVDIFHCAGLSLLSIGILKLLGCPRRLAPVAGAAASVVATLTLGILLKNKGLSTHSVPVLGLLLGVWPGSYFPFLHWFIFPAFGVLFGDLLINSGNPGMLYRRIALLSGIPLAGYLVSLGMLFHLSPTTAQHWLSEQGFYHLPVIPAFGYLGFAGLWLALFHAIRNRLPSLISRLLTEWSRLVTPIYLIHWVFLGFSILALGFKKMDAVSVLFFSAVLMGASHGAALCWSVVLKKVRGLKTPREVRL